MPATPSDTSGKSGALIQGADSARRLAKTLNKCYVLFNNGGCHGKLAGQNGFKISLRGYAPEWDFEALTQELNGRRINSMNDAPHNFADEPSDGNATMRVQQLFVRHQSIVKAFILQENGFLHTCTDRPLSFERGGRSGLSFMAQAMPRC